MRALPSATIRSATIRFTLAAACLFLLTIGCTKSDSNNEIKPGKNEPLEETHNAGSRGGKNFHLTKNGKLVHDYLAEIVCKERKIFLYIIDHDDAEKFIPVAEKEIKITGLKAGEKKLSPITLTLQTKGKQSWFEASGDAIPAEIKTIADLNGGIFSITINKEKYEVPINSAPVVEP